MFERPPQLALGVARMGDACLRGEILDSVAHPPRSQEREGQDLQRGGERPVAVDVLEIPSQRVFRANLVGQDALPGDTERSGALEDPGMRSTLRSLGPALRKEN